MKKITKSLFLGLFGFVLASCGTSINQKGSTNQENMNINPKSKVGYVGDPMPFYDNGEMNIFYLQDGRNTTLGFHPFALMTTKDYVSYNDHGVVIPYEDELDSPDFALGTGSVIKDKTGKYHCFYTGHNSRKNTGLPYFEKIQHATSDDKIHWQKHKDKGFYGGENDFRDPYVYLADDGIYHMLITTRNLGGGVIKDYISSDLWTWTYNEIFFKNDSGTYNMECPTFIKYNDYYYLSYSEQGNNRVTHYRYKKNLSDPWIKPTVDYLDGEGFYAGRMEKDNDKLMMVGWCATREGEYDTGKLDWGGNLVVHELKQKENGLLDAKMVSSVKDKLSNEVSYKLKNGDDLSKMSFDKTSAKAYTVESLSKKITRISFDIKINDLDGSIGLSFNTLSNHTLSNEVFMLNFKTGYALYYANATGFNQLGKIDVCVPCDFKLGIMHVDIVIDNQIITAYINNEKALTTRFYDMKENTFSFFMNKADAEFSSIKFFE